MSLNDVADITDHPAYGPAAPIRKTTQSAVCAAHGRMEVRLGTRYCPQNKGNCLRPLQLVDVRPPAAATTERAVSEAARDLDEHFDSQKQPAPEPTPLPVKKPEPEPVTDVTLRLPDDRASDRWVKATLELAAVCDLEAAACDEDIRKAEADRENHRRLAASLRAMLEQLGETD